MRKSIIALLTVLTVMLVGCGDPVFKIEEKNTYRWQKYMNQEEYDSLKEGMSYMDVVRAAGGGAEDQGNGKFLWHDEQIITKAYIIEFKEDKLVGKEITELEGRKKTHVEEDKEAEVEGEQKPEDVKESDKQEDVPAEAEKKE